MKNIINKYKQLKVNHQSLTTNHFSVGFTLVELLIVIAIIGMLASISVVGYSQVTKQSRDTRRKADLEAIRAALEQYRSNTTNAEPYPASITFSCSSPGTIQDTVGGSTVVYMPKVPDDPRCSNGWASYSYTYNASTDLYELTASLETMIPATYRVDPYGVK